MGVGAGYRMTVRDGPRTSKVTVATLDELFEAVAHRAEALVRAAPGRGVKTPLGEYAAVDRVTGRIELAGPRAGGRGRLRAGLDVRGDGSVEAFVGRLRRRPVEPAPGESPSAALRRTFEGQG